ncbi:MAG: membrane protein insertion efficiency factor YidD [Trichlorobacter sp.]
MLSRVLITCIRCYQLCISPFLPGVCRFYPSCSSYSIESIRRYGAIKGGAMAAYRIVRCHPWHPGGYDPVR